MITDEWAELLPAYGKHPKTVAQARDWFLDGKDWELARPNGGKYCSIRDFAPGVHVLLRYGRDRITGVKVPAKVTQ